MPHTDFVADDFRITVELVPPEGGDPGSLLNELEKISHLPFHGFSVASNPIAKPRMSALAFSRRVQDHTDKPAVLHCTVRDQNRLGLQSELWGARALDIRSLIALTGDHTKTPDVAPVNNVSVYELISMSDAAGLHTGCVLDFRPESNGMDREVRRLARKQAAGAKFVVTQPVYDIDTADAIQKAGKALKLPVIMGILPLVSLRHARFLNEQVDGIQIPSDLVSRLEAAEDPLKEGILSAIELLELAKSRFAGACIMPPFDRFGLLTDILNPP